MSPNRPDDPPPVDEPPGLEVRIAVRDVVDPDHIEKTTGPAFYTHLRGADAIVDFRVRALARAYGHYEKARKNAVAEPEMAGVGLLVLQRVFLMVEDLGGLIYAVTGPNPWSRLTSYYAPELDKVFVDVLEGRQSLRELLLLPTDEQLHRSPSLGHAEAHAAATRLRDLTLAEVTPLLEFASAFWMAHRDAAKSTMHGFGVVASEHLIAPPGAGELSELVPLNSPRPFAVALVSQDDKTALKVETTHHHLDLTPASVEMVRNTGVAAAELYRLIARAHRDALGRKQPWVLTNAYQDRL